MKPLGELATDREENKMVMLGKPKEGISGSRVHAEWLSSGRLDKKCFVYHLDCLGENAEE